MLPRKKKLVKMSIIRNIIFIIKEKKKKETKRLMFEQIETQMTSPGSLFAEYLFQLNKILILNEYKSNHFFIWPIDLDAKSYYTLFISTTTQQNGFEIAYVHLPRVCVNVSVSECVSLYFV